MSAPTSPGLALLLELVRDAARDRRCTSCGQSLGAASVAPGDVDPERIVARLVCACGAAELVEVRPGGENGYAELR